MLLPIDQQIRTITDEILKLEEQFSDIYLSDIPDSVKRRRTRTLQRKIDKLTDELVLVVSDKYKHATENTLTKAYADLL